MWGLFLIRNAIAFALVVHIVHGYKPSGIQRSSFVRQAFFGTGMRTNDPSAGLRFKKTIKIDPTIRTPLTDMKFSDTTRRVLQQKGFSDMTPVQSQCYDQVFGGEDVIARSKTGTGKTLAFGLPLIEAIVSKGLHTTPSPLIVVLEPTRELAMQVAEELDIVCRAHGMKTISIYGGASIITQEVALRRGVQIVVATPGRMLDHIKSGTINLNNVQHVVLDEGDTMLEMGFQQAVESILLNVKNPGEKSRMAAANALDSYGGFGGGVSNQQPARKVQMLLFSATMPGWIVSLTDKHMADPVFLDAVADGENRLADTISHYAVKVNSRDRMQSVSRMIEDLILTKGAGGQSIVFVNRKEDADILANSGCFKQLRSQVLHGDISQYTRQHTIRQFKEGKVDVLIATDVAARGLDIKGVDLVVHTAPPKDPDFFVHRSGRTGRAGRNGTSIMMYGPEDGRALDNFESQLRFRFQDLAPPTQAEITRAFGVIAEKKISEVNYEVVSHFLPQAKQLLKRTAETGKPDPSDSDDMLRYGGTSSTAEGLEVLLAKCLATISNRHGAACK